MMAKYQNKSNEKQEKSEENSHFIQYFRDLRAFLALLTPSQIPFQACWSHLACFMLQVD